jgi:hypothetical protein
MILNGEGLRMNGLFVVVVGLLMRPMELCEGWGLARLLFEHIGIRPYKLPLAVV